MARAAGIILTWEDMNDISAITPLLARVYPNGQADVNHFHAAGGMGFVIRELLKAGLVHSDVTTIWGEGLSAYAKEPVLQDGVLTWREAPDTSLDDSVLRGVDAPFSPEGGLREITGNLGRAIAKVSAVKSEHQIVEAPCVVFDDQDDFLAAFKAKSLPDGNFICVVRFQGPQANGMPELHSLTPSLTSYLDSGRLVALVTDGRMSGASVLVSDGGHPLCLSTESGHATYAPTNDFETQIHAILRKKYGRVTIEHILSGPGLVNLYKAIAQINGDTALGLSPAEITDLDGPDSKGCRQTVDSFLDILASVCGDLALYHGATSGMSIAGGIVPRLIPVMDAVRFRARMEAKAPLQSMVAAIPSRVITYPYAALMGAAHALGDHEI